MSDRETATCPICNGTVREPRSGERWICDGCARYWTEEELGPQKAISIGCRVRVDWPDPEELPDNGCDFTPAVPDEFEATVTDISLRPSTAAWDDIIVSVRADDEIVPDGGIWTGGADCHPDWLTTIRSAWEVREAERRDRADA